MSPHRTGGSWQRLQQNHRTDEVGISWYVQNFTWRPDTAREQPCQDQLQQEPKQSCLRHLIHPERTRRTPNKITSTTGTGAAERIGQILWKAGTRCSYLLSRQDQGFNLRIIHLGFASAVRRKAGKDQRLNYRRASAMLHKCTFFFFFFWEPTDRVTC